MIPEIKFGSPSAPEAMTPKVVASQMQAMFMELMIKAMEDSVEAKDGLFGASSSSEIYRGMFRQHLAAAMSGQLQSPLEKQLQQELEKTESSPEQMPAGEPEVQPLSLPIDGRITSPVGWRHDPLGEGLRFHRGTDIAAPLGTPIKAVEAGVVVESGAKGGYGTSVVVQTDSGRRMLYAHNLANLVRVGDRVQAGQAVAQVGASGRATGPHVHFEVME